MIKPISTFFRNGVVSQFLTITFKTQFIYRKVNCTIFLDLGPFTRRRCVEQRDNATNGRNRTYILMICSHCRVAAREATIAAIIARIGHVSNLTTHILF